MKTTAKTIFRGDIQGLRAIAVGLVVIYHLWPLRLTGGFIGVDVFFVISGFLITSHLVKNPPRKPRDFGNFWIRRVKRLLPASFLVLAVSLVGIRLIAPESVWKDWGGQVLAATFYFENWSLAASSVDYLAADNAPSAVQHFWSLSVEEQFYLFWPLIIGGLFVLGAILGVKGIKVPRLGVFVILAASLAYSIHLTNNEPGIAYFSTFTRGWELAVGGMIAMIPKASERFRASHAASALSWGGLAAIVGAAVYFDAATPFPSYTAALPVLGTAATIWAHAEAKSSPTGILSWKPSRFIGDHSYSIYLWHWPIIVLAPFLIGTLKWPQKLMVLALTVALAMATKTFVEDRFRKSMDTSKVITGGRFLLVGSLTLGLVSGGFLYTTQQRELQQGDLLTQASAVENTVGFECFGGAAMINDCAVSSKDLMTPSPAAVKTDKSAAYADDCWSSGEFKDRPICTYGTGKTQVALSGNSHAGHWLPALQEIAKENDWTITTFLASRCAPTDSPLAFDSAEKIEGCLDYGKWVLDQTANDQFDLIITSSRQSLPVAGETLKTTLKPAIAGYKSYLEKWSSAGTPIIVLRDNPFPGHTVPNVPDCISASEQPIKECSGTSKSWHSMDPLTDAAKQINSDRIPVIDMSEFFCRDGVCPAIIGSVIPYFDGSHISATYARTLTPYLKEKIDKKLNRLG